MWHTNSPYTVESLWEKVCSGSLPAWKSSGWTTQGSGLQKALGKEGAGCSLEEQRGPWVLDLGLACESNVITEGLGCLVSRSQGGLESGTG